MPSPCGDGQDARASVHVDHVPHAGPVDRGFARAQQDLVGCAVRLTHHLRPPAEADDDLVTCRVALPVVPGTLAVDDHHHAALGPVGGDSFAVSLQDPGVPGEALDRSRSGAQAEVQRRGQQVDRVAFVVAEPHAADRRTGRISRS